MSSNKWQSRNVDATKENYFCKAPEASNVGCYFDILTDFIICPEDAR
jgi:hypothetical protein